MLRKYSDNIKKVSIFRPLSLLLNFLINQTKKAHFYIAQIFKNLASRENEIQEKTSQMCSDSLMNFKPFS